MSTTISTGDRLPVLHITLSADDPVIATDFVLIRILGRVDRTLLIDRAPDTVTQNGDSVDLTMTWTALDTADPAVIDIQVEVTWPGNLKQTFRTDPDDNVYVVLDYDAWTA